MEAPLRMRDEDLSPMQVDCAANSEDFFSFLPTDVKCEILSYLKAETLLRSRTVSKSWADISLRDSIWKSIVQNMYGPSSFPPKKSYFSLYKENSDRFCQWDEVHHHPGIIVDSTGRSANCDPSCKNDTHLPIRGKQGVKAGKHYFEVSFTVRPDAKPAFSSLLCAVGVADRTFATDRKVGSGYTKDNNGIGYYSSGFQFAYGKEMEYGQRVTFKVGNVVGMLMDMDNGEVQFFRDRKPIGEVHKLKRDCLGDLELYPLVLSERGLIITITKLNGPILVKRDGNSTELEILAVDPPILCSANASCK